MRRTPLHPLTCVSLSSRCIWSSLIFSSWRICIKSASISRRRNLQLSVHSSLVTRAWGNTFLSAGLTSSKTFCCALNDLEEGAARFEISKFQVINEPIRYYYQLQLHYIFSPPQFFSWAGGGGETPGNGTGKQESSVRASGSLHLTTKQGLTCSDQEAYCTKVCHANSTEHLPLSKCHPSQFSKLLTASRLWQWHHFPPKRILVPAN